MAAHLQHHNPGKTVLITGVTRGLGRALALELAARGHLVVGCGRSPTMLASLQDQLDGRSRHLLRVADLASVSNVEEFAKLVIETAGVPDIVVNNAAIINKNAKFCDISLVEFDSVIDINVKGTANIMRYFLPHMVERNSGVMVNMSSLWGRTVSPNVVPYCTSKWAIEGMSKAVATEMPDGVAVIALDPGAIDTDMTEYCFGSDSSKFASVAEWAPNAANFILGLTAKDNGRSLTLEEENYHRDRTTIGDAVVLYHAPSG